MFSLPLLVKKVNSARNCILQCSENNVCLNSCVVTHLPEDFLQNYIASVKENEIETMEHQELPIKNNNRKRLVAAPLIRDGHRRHEDNYYDNQPVHTVAHAPDLTPLVNSVIGQLLPYILQAIGSNRPPAVRGGQPTLMGGQPTHAAALPTQPTQQPYSGGQTNVGGGLPVQPGMGGGLPRQPAMGGGQAGQPYMGGGQAGQPNMGSSPGQPDMGSSPGQPGMGGVPGNEVPPMNGQPPMNVPPPAMTAPPALPSSPAMNNPQPPLDPSLMTSKVHKNVFYLIYRD